MEWQVKKIGDVSHVIAGQSPEGRFYNKSGRGLPFYQGKKEFGERYVGEPTTWTTEITKEAQDGDILMSVRAPVGPTNFATGKICIGRGLAAIRVSKEINKDFLFYFLQSFESKITGNTGAVFNSINKTQIENIEILLPTLSEQKRIVKVIDEVFDKTARARENAEKNLQNSKKLFESYLQKVFLNPKKDWGERKLKEVCDKLFAGGDVPKNNLSRIKTEKYTIPIFANGFKDKGLYGYTDVRKVIKPSVTISARGTIGYAEIRKEPFYPVVRLIVLTPNTKIIELPFLYYMTHNFKFSNTGTSIPQLTIPMIENTKIPIPPIQEQKTIVKQIDELSAETKKLESIYRKKLENLQELKKSILQKAFSGAI